MRVASALTIAAALTIAIVACTAPAEEIDDDEQGVTSNLITTGPCAGKPIDAAVQCAVRKGAKVLSYYRSAEDQRRVRRENHCTNECEGSAGCIRPTAGCYTSPHTSCKAVDLVSDGAPLSASQLRECGLAKTTAPHKN